MYRVLKVDSAKLHVDTVHTMGSRPLSIFIIEVLLVQSHVDSVIDCLAKKILPQTDVRALHCSTGHGKPVRPPVVKIIQIH